MTSNDAILHAHQLIHLTFNINIYFFGMYLRGNLYLKKSIDFYECHFISLILQVDGIQTNSVIVVKLNKVQH